MHGTLRTLRCLSVGLGVTILLAWCTVAIWLWPGSAPSWISMGLAGLFGLVSSGSLLFLRRKRGVLLLNGVVIAGVIVWWNLIPASGGGEYFPEMERPSWASFEGDQVTVHDVRSFEYRTETDFVARWEDRTYDLSKVRTVDFIISYWGQESIAHTFLSFFFSDDRYLAVSIEARRELHEPIYSPLVGLFKQYELIYVWADERDLVGLRTSCRNEDVYVYETIADPAGARDLLRDMLARTNQLRESPQFYNTVGQNCATTITDHIGRVRPKAAISFSHRILLSGYSDDLAYETGWLRTDASFQELKRRSHVTARGKAAGNDPRFSSLIRTHIAGR